MKKKIALILYIDKNTARWIGRYREVSRIKNSQMELLRGVHSNLTSMDREAIEFESRWIKIAITAIEKRSSKGSIDSLAVERYREVVEIA